MPRFSLKNPTFFTALLIFISLYASPPGSALAEPLRHSQSIDDNRLVAPELGLTLTLPPHSLITTQRTGQQPTYLIRDGSPEPQWTMRISALKSILPHSSAKKQIDDLILGLINQEKPFEIILNQRVILSDNTQSEPKGDSHGDSGSNPGGGGNSGGYLCFLRQKTENGRSFISGWLILPLGNQSFIFISIYTTPEHLARLRPQFDACFASIELQTQHELRSAQQNALALGASFLAGIDEIHLRSLVGRKQVLRIYRPSTRPDEPDTEIGWSLIEVLDAPRGLLSISRPPSQYTAAERESGFLVHMQARIIADRSRNLYLDMDGRYWMAWDQSSEQWSSKGTIRQGEAATTESETGLRTPAGSSPPTLTVIKAGSDSPAGAPFSWRVPVAYLSQPLGWMLGELLALENTPPPSVPTPARSFSFYFYRTRPADRQPSLSQRTDTWARATDGSNHWLLTTQISSEPAPSLSRYSPEGALIRRTSPDGTITEAIKLNTLRRLWQKKGLLTR